MSERSAVTRFAAAAAALGEGRHAEAADLAARAAAGFGCGPDAANALVLRAQALRGCDARRAALEAVGQALLLLRPAPRRRAGVDVVLTQALLLRAALLSDIGDPAGAVDVLAAALAELEERLPDDHPTRFRMAMEKGVAEKALGRYDDGATSYAVALDALERGALGADARAALVHNLGGLAHARGDAEEGLGLALHALELRLTATPPDPLAIAVERSAVAPLLLDLGQLDAAEAMLSQAREAFEGLLGHEDVEVAVVLHNLGELRLRQGDAGAACEALAEAVAIKRRTLGPGHPEVAVSAAALDAARRLCTDSRHDAARSAPRP